MNETSSNNEKSVDKKRSIESQASKEKVIAILRKQLVDEIEKQATTNTCGN